jgi:hypothetical protein
MSEQETWINTSNSLSREEGAIHRFWHHTNQSQGREEHLLAFCFIIFLLSGKLITIVYQKQQPSQEATMAPITDQATLKAMQGKQIRVMRGRYGGKNPEVGCGYGWTDKSATKMLKEKRWVIIDMTGKGKELKHVQINRSSFRYFDWFNEPKGATFEERLLQQHPEIADAMEELAQTLARFMVLKREWQRRLMCH